jgi:hypothetical protein
MKWPKLSPHAEGFLLAVGIAAMLILLLAWNHATNV